jgi:hypothetical protein
MIFWKIFLYPFFSPRNYHWFLVKKWLNELQKQSCQSSVQCLDFGIIQIVHQVPVCHWCDEQIAPIPPQRKFQMHIVQNYCNENHWWYTFHFEVYFKKISISSSVGSDFSLAICRHCTQCNIQMWAGSTVYGWWCSVWINMNDGVQRRYHIVNS